MSAEVIGIVSGIYTAFKGVKDVKDVSSVMKEQYNKTKLIRTNGSITRLLSAYIVEPVAIVSDDLKLEANIDKIIELNSDIFSSYYAQAFDVLTKINGIDHNIAITLLSTDKISLGREDFDFCGELLGNCDTLSVENGYDSIPNPTNDRKRKRKESTDELNDKVARDLRGSKTKVSDVKSMTNIIQRNIDLEVMIKTNGIAHTIVIPIIIKLNILFASNSQIINMLTPNASDKSFGNRLDDYRSGSISFGNLIFAGDLIDKYKKNKIKDENDLLNIINNRTINANAKLVTDGAVGFEKYYNMLIISNTTKAMIEKHLKGKIKKDKYKEQLMTQSMSLLVTHVDEDYERVSIFTKDISGTSEVTFKALSKGNKDNDMTEIFKALISNRSPVL